LRQYSPSILSWGAITLTTSLSPGPRPAAVSGHWQMADLAEPTLIVGFWLQVSEKQSLRSNTMFVLGLIETVAKIS